MTDPRLRKLADNLIRYSCAMKKGEKVLIEIFDCEEILAEEMLKAAYRAGVRPYFSLYSAKAEREWLIGADREQMEDRARWEAVRMQQMDAYISFRGNHNTAESAGIPQEQQAMYQAIYSREVQQLRLRKKWCVLRYPNEAMAQLSGMSTREFEDFYFDVCTLDYAKMDRAMDPLQALMEQTDRVRMLGPGTDLCFSIKGLPAIKCAGNKNIPDGELFTAPVRDSVNGRISFNTPSLYQGFKFENIALTFQNGKITEATSNNTEKTNAILDTDAGARYVGEFAFGVNPYVIRPMCDTLFDEKIAGSIHFTPGAAYEEAYNGNDSAVHWDLVWIQTPEMGGGEIYFDDVLIRKDGRFVLPELECLNPENLK